jgi:hypothetical protein
MSARSFSVSQWFASPSRGHDAKTPINVDGYRTTLQGLPTVFTDSALVALASEQTTDVRMKSPRITTNAGIVCNGAKQFSGDELSSMLAQYAGIESPGKGKGKNRLAPNATEPTTEPTVNGTGN